ncbi:uncharacterized protein EV420DRAFT_617941 [Desarmillaria tabescens]|uniref:Uncharacterized protein n=1 Tax=Armillaria tabescens TaxID=1929756 RepID=A0AA39K8B0_ARMTA|nr:uncharacterized protein EV420DRAFT_617941 [Desarmillaria tabescens]KAK0454063.1 hypothetical protein EV420DRAFT_617941 [Desarmillaria tabescens]
MLPQELVDLIIDNLHGDIPSLQSCALTSRAFLPSSQKAIFSCVHVSSSPPSSLRGHSFDNLHALLSASPHIAPLITSFELSLHYDSTESEFEKIPLFLPLLCNVHRFFLLSATNLIFSWNGSLPVRVQDSLVAFWHTSKIIDLQIEAMGHMAFDGDSRLRMDRWGSLKHLSILWSTPERLWERNDLDPAPLCSPRLESLTVGHFNLDPVKNSQYAGLDISFVRRFSATLGNEDDVPDVQYLLTQFRDTLEYLDFQITLHLTAIEFQERYNYFDLYLCRNLRVVHIGIDTPQDLFPFARLSPSVQEITVEVSFKSQMYSESCCKWSVIDSSIGEQDLPSLLSVKLDIHVSRNSSCSLTICNCGADDSVDVWEVTRNMPILHSKGILKVDRKPKRTVWGTIYS